MILQYDMSYDIVLELLNKLLKPSNVMAKIKCFLTKCKVHFSTRRLSSN